MACIYKVLNCLQDFQWRKSIESCWFSDLKIDPPSEHRPDLWLTFFHWTVNFLIRKTIFFFFFSENSPNKWLGFLSNVILALANDTSKVGPSSLAVCFLYLLATCTCKFGHCQKTLNLSSCTNVFFFLFSLRNFGVYSNYWYLW